MKYENLTCQETDNCRFVLSKQGTIPLIVIGLNPSTADANKPDATMRRVMGFADRNNFDAFVMLNLYPQRATVPSNLDKELDLSKHQANLNAIYNAVKAIKNPIILLAYGDSIGIRNFFRTCLRDIVTKIQPLNPTFVKIGELTKNGNPRHPSRTAYQPLTKIDINELIH